MVSIKEKYEAIIGLEIHVQLKTKTKAYSSDGVSFGGKPNTHVSPISLGHPGTLPFLNRETINSAIKLGLACGCEIRYENQFARKNYFYADLPKGYQITQDKTPICNGGSVLIKDNEGNDKTIRLTRIHMEEDSGKSIHDLDPDYSLIDLNRAGTPLLEIVSEADFRNGVEAYNYLNEMRKLVRYLDISDGNMEEGSLRCDVNVSIRPWGREEFGTKVEVKNLNSFRHVQKAIDFEIQRQYDLIEGGEIVIQQTRSFDPVKGETFLLRVKEDAQEYRYFPEPDLPPVYVDDAHKEKIRTQLPELPKSRLDRYMNELQLSEYDSRILTETKEVAEYFDKLYAKAPSAKSAANFILGYLKAYLNENALEVTDFPISPETAAEVLLMIEQGKISHTIANQKLLPELLKNPEGNPGEIAEKNNWIQLGDEGQLMEWAKAALEAYPEKVEEFRGGKKGLMGLFMGEVMKASRGKADPKKTSALLNKLLNQ
ncbi:MAG: Asp-tRNA(Asn)/Glu-tRNA(Gln) amidotransferase subunit GatB [Cryomorphaceae bacterium]|nr:Asp-tRNA(Asn)/Glu-tRNA(Gln) amidotransferase subunit GatB [Cryomorphaceae bacterium]